MRRSRFVVVLSLVLAVALSATLLPMMQVRAGAGGVTITADKTNIVNDGTDIATLTVTVTDDGNPVADGTTVTFATVQSDPGIILSTTSTTTTGGQATVTVASTADVATLPLIQVIATYAAASGCTSTCDSAPFDVNVLDAALPSMTNSTIDASLDSLPADGTTSTITVTLLNAATDPIAGVDVSLTAGVAGPTLSTSPVTTDANGVATFTTSWLNRDLAASQLVNYTTGDIVGDSISGTFTLTTPITFTTPALPADAPSTVSATPLTILANNVQTSTVTVTLLNAANAPVVGKTVTLAETTSVGGLTIAPASAGSDVTNASGIATFTVRGTNVGAATLQATDSTDSIALTADTVTVTLEAAVAAEGPSTVSATPLTILANNVQTSTVTVTLLSAGGNPVPGKTVTLTDTAALGGLTIAPASAGSEVTNASGVATFTVRGSVAGNAILQATNTTDSVTLTNDQVTVTLVSANPAEGPTTVSAAPLSIPADNATTSLVTVTLRNALSNPVQGKTVTLVQTTSLAGITITPVQPVSDANGIATFTVRGNVVGPATFRATDTTDGIDFTNDLVTITLVTPPADKANSTVTTDKTTVLANNTDTATITVTLRDASGNLLSGKTVSLQTNIAPSGISVNGQAFPFPTVVTVNGVATFTVKSNTAYAQVQFTANVNTDSVLLDTDVVNIQFVQPGADKTQSSVFTDKNTVFANGTDSATISVLVRDVTGFPIPNKSVSLYSLSFPSGIKINDADAPGNPVTTNGNGIATFTVKSTAIAANVTFVFRVNTDGVILDDAADVATISFVAPVPTNTPSNTPTLTPTGPTPTSTGAPTTSAIFSTVYCNYSQAPADGVFKVSISISLRDQNNQPVANHLPVPAVTPPTAGLSFSSPALTDISGNVTYFVSSVTQTAPNAVLISITDQTAVPPVTLAQTCTLIFAAPGSTPVVGPTPIGGLTTTPIGTPFGTATATPTAGLMNANSQGEITGIVVAYRLRVRTGPGLNYEILGLLRYKVTIVLLGRNRAGTWLLTQLDDGRQVWVSSRWIRISRARFRRLPLVDVPPRTPAQPIATPSLRPIVNPASYSAPSDGQGIGMVNVGTLDAYIAPSQSSMIVATLPRNTEMLVIGKSADNVWYYVEVDGNKLWVPATYVSLKQINGAALGVVNPLSTS